jgi:signal transduction histidine kinase
LKVFLLLLLLPVITIYGCKEQPKVVPVVTTPDYKKGLSFLDRQNDSAYYYFNKVVTGSKDSLQIAIAYNSMAVIQSGEGDYFGSQETLLASLNYLNPRKENNQYCLVSDYNELGSTSLNLKNYDAAIDYYDKALAMAKDEASKTIALNNKAFAYQKKGQYSVSAAIYESILGPVSKDEREYARVLCNLASARWLQDFHYNAAPDLLKALQIRKGKNDDWGLNSSYAHLSDYYMHSHPDSALLYSRDMYTVASKLNSADDKLEALQKLILLAPSGEVKAFFTQYERLKDSLETARNKAKNQFALIRYDAEKNKADNLRLQQENAEKRVEIVQQRALGFGVIIAFMVLIAWGIVWYRKRKQKLEMEKQEERLQLSQKVHDVVANGLYRLMMGVEHGETLEKEQLLDKIEDLYEQSRDISYEPAGVAGGDFQAVIARLVGAFGGSETKVLITGNDRDLWKELGARTRKELELILQELMVNMKKHSRARNVVIRFEREAEGVNVWYVDDGVGFPTDFRYGNGLKNTGNRISGIGGRIIFEKNIPSGLRIQIYLPNV